MFMQQNILQPQPNLGKSGVENGGTIACTYQVNRLGIFTSKLIEPLNKMIAFQFIANNMSVIFCDV